MITVKSESEIALMRESGKITRDLLNLLEKEIKVGMSTAEIDRIAYSTTFNGKKMY